MPKSRTRRNSLIPHDAAAVNMALDGSAKQFGE